MFLIISFAAQKLFNLVVNQYWSLFLNFSGLKEGDACANHDEVLNLHFLVAVARFLTHFGLTFVQDKKELCLVAK